MRPALQLIRRTAKTAAKLNVRVNPVVSMTVQTSLRLIEFQPGLIDFPSIGLAIIEPDPHSTILAIRSSCELICKLSFCAVPRLMANRTFLSSI